jgi:hypothetical protein
MLEPPPSEQWTASLSLASRWPRTSLVPARALFWPQLVRWLPSRSVAGGSEGPPEDAHFQAAGGTMALLPALGT